MTWYYSVHGGTVSHNDLDKGHGYSGIGPGLNNHNFQADHDIGPIPQGKWKIGTAFDHPHLGPCVMHLNPEEGTETFGRSGFFIHGDNSKHNHTASHGCIVLDPQLRELISKSTDRVLEVIP